MNHDDLSVFLLPAFSDHDAGTFQKILEEGVVTVITTPTIMESFLRKYQAISGIDSAFLKV